MFPGSAENQRHRDSALKQVIHDLFRLPFCLLPSVLFPLCRSELHRYCSAFRRYFDWRGFSCLFGNKNGRYNCRIKEVQMSDAAFELEQVNELLKRYYIALSERDIELLSDVMAHDEDMVNFGTDSDERWTGWNELEEIYRKQFEAITKYEISRHEQVVKLNPSADTAWFSEILKARVEAMDDIYELSLRISGVLEKRDGKWVIVHFHRSLPKEGFTVKYLDTHSVRF